MNARGWLIFALLLTACGPSAQPAGPASHDVASGSRPRASAETDPLGPKPVPAVPAAFVPPTPTTYTLPNGLNVWLLSRPALPLVAMSVVVRSGASADPEGKGGLAMATAGMLDEGAGKRGALDIARDIDLLGASLVTHVYSDYTVVSLESLKKNFGSASEIVADVVLNPTFSPAEWARTQALLVADLKSRDKDPGEVSDVMALRALFGAKHPYGHPTDGTVESVGRFSLADAKRFYSTHFRPDHATVVVAGDINRGELDALLGKTFAAWKAPSGPPPAQGTFAEPTSSRRIVVVDKADAPQSVVTLLRPGIRAADADAAVLGRTNIPLGGSFTSRLNQDLREERGLTYGAKSRVGFTKHRGMIAAQAAVFVDKTGEALRAMLADVEAYAANGPTEEETTRSLLVSRSDFVESFESLVPAVARLARYAGVGLPPDHDAKLAVARARATRDDLKRAAATYFNPKDAIVVIVGPKAKVLPQLEGLGPIEIAQVR